MRLHRAAQILLALTLIVLAVGLVFSPLKTRAQIGSSIEYAKAAEETPSPLMLPLMLFRAPHTSLFGVEMIHITDVQGFSEVKEANAAWVRRNGLLWSRVEKIEGSYDWSTLSGLDGELFRASSNGMEVILVIRSTPPWAQQDTGSFCGRIREDKLQSFAKFMNAVVDRYSKPPYNVKYFEIWNEQDADRSLGALDPTSFYGCWGNKNDPYFGGEYYTDVLTHVYPAVKDANPKAQVVVGGLLLGCKQGESTIGCDHSEKYLEGMLYHNGARDGGNYFDLLNLHSYDHYYGDGVYRNAAWGSNLGNHMDDGPTFVKKLRFLRETLNAYGFGNKEIIITETALLCGSTGDEYYCQTEAFENTKANYLAESFALTLAEGIRTNIWYAVTSTWRGSNLLDDNLNPLPAYYAFDFAEDTLNNALFKRELSEYSNIKGLEFELNGKKIWMLWSTILDGNGNVQPVQITLPSEPSNVYMVTGSELVNFQGTSLLVTAAPLYVEWK
jgi:hypothetical protein